MAKTTDLPTEILSIIFDFERDSRQTLTSIARTNKRFNAIAIPILYKSITIDDACSSDLSWGPEIAERVLFLASTILLRPDYAALIQSLRLGEFQRLPSALHYNFKTDFPIDANGDWDLGRPPLKQSSRFQRYSASVSNAFKRRPKQKPDVVEPYDASLPPQRWPPLFQGIYQRSLVTAKIDSILPRKDLPVAHDEWTTKLIDKPSSDAITAFAISQLPNLRHLALHDRRGVDSPSKLWLHLLDLVKVGRCDGTPRIFAKLECISLNGSFREVDHQPRFHDNYHELGGHSGSPRALVYIIGLPGLRHLHGSNIGHLKSTEPCGDRTDLLGKLLAPRSLALETLDLLDNCSVYHRDLERLLESCKALRTLKLSVITDRSAYVPFNTSGMYKALLSQRHSLEHVVLGEVDWVDHSPLNVSLLDSMDFQRFSRLTNLELPILLVFGHTAIYSDVVSAQTSAALSESHGSTKYRLARHMPPSIEKLTITGLGNDGRLARLNTALVAMLDEREESFPSLRSIDVRADRHDALDWDLREPGIHRLFSLGDAFKLAAEKDVMTSPVAFADGFVQHVPTEEV